MLQKRSNPFGFIKENGCYLGDEGEGEQEYEDEHFIPYFTRDDVASRLHNNAEISMKRTTDGFYLFLPGNEVSLFEVNCGLVDSVFIPAVKTITLALVKSGIITSANPALGPVSWALVTYMAANFDLIHLMNKKDLGVVMHYNIRVFGVPIPLEAWSGYELLGFDAHDSAPEGTTLKDSNMAVQIV
jgi:hypothetical protein